MKVASLKILKAELGEQSREQLLELCLHLSKYKKENKELLNYLLFEASDEQTYIKGVKAELDELFKDVNKHNLYLAKKTIRKILRTANKYIKYSGNKQTEVEILLHFCKKLRKAGLPLHINTVLGNTYFRQVQKIKKAVSMLHEDMYLDYADEIEKL